MRHLTTHGPAARRATLCVLVLLLACKGSAFQAPSSEDASPARDLGEGTEEASADVANVDSATAEAEGQTIDAPVQDTADRSEVMDSHEDPTVPETIPSDHGTTSADSVAVDNPTEDSCVPVCEGKECGPDNCGGSCGSCVFHKICNESSLCTCEDICKKDEIKCDINDTMRFFICSIHNESGCLTWGESKKCEDGSVCVGNKCIDNNCNNINQNGCCKENFIYYCENGVLKNKNCGFLNCGMNFQTHKLDCVIGPEQNNCNF